MFIAPAGIGFEFKLSEAMLLDISGGVVYTSVGAGLGEVFAQGEAPDFGLIFEPHILLPLLGLCALAALPILIKALRGGKDI